MEMVGGAWIAGVDLFLRALRLRKHLGACAGDVHAVSDRSHIGRRATVHGRGLAGLFFKFVCRADPLRHDVRADLLWRGLRLAAEMVAPGTARFRAEYSDLGLGGVDLVEDSGV